MLKGYMLICRNAEGVHGKRTVGNPWVKIMLARFQFSVCVQICNQNSVIPSSFHDIAFSFKSKQFSDRSVQWNNWTSYYHEIDKINETHWVSVATRVSKDRVRALGRGAHSKNLQQSPPSPIHYWKPHAAPATHQGRTMETAQSASIRGDLKATQKQHYCLT